MSKPNCYVCGSTPRFDEELAEYVCDECEEERDTLKSRLQWALSNLCEKHADIQQCSNGPCPMCELDTLMGLLSECRPRILDERYTDLDIANVDAVELRDRIDAALSAPAAPTLDSDGGS